MFPNGRNDDQVDALSMALSTLGSLWDFPVGLVPLTEEVMRSAIGPPRPNKKPPEEEKDTGRNWWPSRGGWINV